MITRTIRGVVFHVESPVRYKVAGLPVWVIRDERGWYVDAVSRGGDRFGKGVDSLEDAARIISSALTIARRA